MTFSTTEQTADFIKKCHRDFAGYRERHSIVKELAKARAYLINEGSAQSVTFDATFSFEGVNFRSEITLSPFGPCGWIYTERLIKEV